MTKRLLLGILLGTSLLATACSSPSSDTTGAASSDVNGSTSVPIVLEASAPAEWARCWVEATAGAANGQSVLCAGSASASAPFVIDKISIDLATGGQSLGSKLLVASGRPAATPQGRAVLPSQFPITVTITVAPNYGKTNMGVGPENDALTTTVTLASPTAATKEHPAIIHQPFAVWPIAIVEQARSADDLFAYLPAIYDVPAAPFTTASGHPQQLRVAADTDSIPVANRQHVIRASLVAPASGALTVGVTLNLKPGGLADLKQNALIDGPGIYIAAPSGLRKATAADVLPAELLQSAPLPVMAPPAASGGPCDESRRPASDPDLTPCGASGQRCCNPIPACANSGTCGGADGECIGTTCL